MLRKPTFLTSLAVVALALGITGVAFAAWSSTGSGTGSAKATTSSSSTITGVTPIVANDLYPGATKESFVTISNPNPYPIEVTSVSAGWSKVANTSCVAGTVRTDAVGDGAAAITRSDAATTVIGPSPATGTYKLTVRMADNPDDACKGQTFVIAGANTPATVDMTATVRSAADSQDF